MSPQSPQSFTILNLPKNFFYSKNPKMTCLKLNSRWVKNPIFHRLYLRKYNDPKPKMFTRGIVICLLSNLQISLFEASPPQKSCSKNSKMTHLKQQNPMIDVVMPNVMIQHLKNDKKLMNTVHFEGETSFYNISNLEDKIKWDKMILRLGLLGVYIGDKWYNYTERVQWRVLA